MYNSEINIDIVGYKDACLIIIFVSFMCCIFTCFDICLCINV